MEKLASQAAVATEVNGDPQGLCWSTETLICPLLFIEVSKIVAEQRGAQLRCHSASHPPAPAAACHFSLWDSLFACTSFMLQELFLRKARSSMS